MHNEFRKIFTYGLFALAGMGVCLKYGDAQTPTPSQQLAAPVSGKLVVQPSTLTQAIPDHLTGNDDGKSVRWTIKDAILAALDKNPDIEIYRQNVQIAQFGVTAAQGVYDPLTTSAISYNAVKTPNLSRFSGSAADYIENDTTGYNFGYSKLIERSGGSYQVNFTNTRQVSNTASLATSYNPSLVVSMTQPLWKNLRIDPNRRQIQIAKKTLDLSDAQFRQQVIQIIANVQQAYWTLAFAIRSEQIQRDALDLAMTQLKNNQEQVKTGTLADLDAVTAATQVETVRQQVYQAMQTTAQAEDSLKLLTVGGSSDEIWTTHLIPVEPFEVKSSILPLSDALNLALTNRPEVRQFAIQKEMNDIDVALFKNQSKPQIDLTASYGLVGIGGGVASFPDANGILQPAQVAPGFIGGYGTSLGNLFNNSFPAWKVGLNFSFPLRNRTAQANLGSAIETGRQIDTQTRKQLQSIQADVRLAYHAVEAARMRIGAARAAREYAEQQLAGEQDKFSVGLSTTFLVLTRQNDLSQARGVEVQTLTDYNKALSSLQLAISTTLSDNSIEVK
jgi:outer membrane protein